MLNYQSDQGVTFLELLVFIGITAVLMGIAVVNLRDFQDPLQSGADQLAAYFRQVRSRAMSTTLAYTITATSTRNLTAGFAAKCTDSPTTEDSSQQISLPLGADLTDTAWTLCYSSRGLPDANLVVSLHDNDGGTKEVEVYLGGAVKVNE